MSLKGGLKRVVIRQLRMLGRMVNQLRDAPSAGGGPTAAYRCRSPHLSPQNPLVGWDDASAAVAVGVD